jgi:hypothetical protein
MPSPDLSLEKYSAALEAEYQARRRAPQVGQIVHYWPLQCEKTHDHNQPFRADICHVHDDGRVNLIICNEIGIASRRTKVPLNLDGTARSGEASMFPNGM